MGANYNLVGSQVSTPQLEEAVNALVKHDPQIFHQGGWREVGMGICYMYSCVYVDMDGCV